MKRMIAIMTAFVLACVCTAGVYTVSAYSIGTDSVAFSTWINQYKDKSWHVLVRNVKPDTVLYMGSSEFHHGKRYASHPTNLFNRQNRNVMCMGAAYNQSLHFAITTGALGKSLKTRKAILMLSPSWFTPKGVAEQAFSMRFSESQYVEMLKNPALSRDIKQKIAKRTQQLVKNDPGLSKNVEKANALYLSQTSGFPEKQIVQLRGMLLKAREIVSVGLLWNLYHRSLEKRHRNRQTGAPDFLTMLEASESRVEKKISNPFNMLDWSYRKKFQPHLKIFEGRNRNKSFCESPEYSDLQLFLQVCEESGIEVLLLLQPINGDWYDFTGFEKEKREIVAAKAGEICRGFSGVRFCNLFDKCYEPGFFEDNIHPSEKGWVMINEEVFRFIQEN